MLMPTNEVDPAALCSAAQKAGFRLEAELPFGALATDASAAAAGAGIPGFASAFREAQAR